MDVLATLGTLVRGGGDPTHRRDGAGGLWRATRTPEGPALLHLVPRVAEGAVLAQAWGAGGQWALEHVPVLLGDGDDDGDFRPEHPLLQRARAAHPGWRVPRTLAVWEALVPAVLEQRVTGAEAHTSWRWLVRAHGEPAPGPGSAAEGPAAGMRLPPTPEAVRSVPSWQWLRAGVDAQRRRALVDAASRAAGLERTTELSGPDAAAALRSVEGVGVWTAAEVRQRAHGDADAFSWHDYHVARNVCWALTGRDGDDARCAELVEVHRGHRYRVQRLVELERISRPRRGPRRTLPGHLP